MILSLLDSELTFYVDKTTSVGVLVNLPCPVTRALSIFLFPVNFMANQNEWICESQVTSYVYYEESRKNLRRASPTKPFTVPQARVE